MENAPPPQQQAVEISKLIHQQKSGASWFFWIAGLSLVNSIVLLTGGNWNFVIGLGITQIIDAITHQAGDIGKIAGFAMDLFVAGFVVLFGVFAIKGHGWSFIIGMILYALDGLLFLMAQDWLGLGFHAFALFCIFSGYKANRQLATLQPQ